MMIRYSVTVSGTGHECYFFPLTNDQYTTIEEFDLNSMTNMQVIHKLGFEDLSSSEFVLFGPVENNFKLNITDEWGDEICDLLPMQITTDSKIESHKFMLTNHLVYENTVSGQFYKLDFFIDEDNEFELDKLQLIYTLVGDKKVLTSISYDNFDLHESIEHLDYDFITSDIYRVRKI